ncbi:MAG: hypothetical protein GF317_18970 [Candidatus Lokiarchaeota archaeon]|nr:hypothetical protein [Candidatus Lokiarchaeota archaeon]MBD3201598.1 hypothetical protein [Candidatus Lokiarchaeota archaeon]
MNDLIILFNLLEQFINSEYVSLEKYRKNPIIFHYYSEIIRYWNKINFALQSTLRSLQFNRKLKPRLKVIYGYSLYRTFWEKVKIGNLLKALELNLEQNFFYSIKVNLIKFLKRLKTFSWDLALKNKTTIEKISIEYAIPSFFIQRIRPYMDLPSLKDNLRLMNNFNLGKTYLIWNKYPMDLDSEILFRKAHEESNIPIKGDDDFDGLYTIPNEYKKEVLKSTYFKNGDIIIADKGSLAIIDLLNPQKHELILDLCAAPGIKTALIKRVINDRSILLTNEFQRERIAQMKNLMSFLNIQDISILNADGISFPNRETIKFDRILLDAPCSGSGTFLINPELKWRQNSGFLHQNELLQKKLIQSAIRLLKPEGILVYSTCSLYSEEGEKQIQQFLEYLEPLKIPQFYSPSYKIDGRELSGTGRLFPATHGTQGFFVGKFKKKG